MGADRQTIDHFVSELIFHHTMVTRELSQVSRNLTLAILRNMRDEQSEAVKEIAEINGRLKKVEDSLAGELEALRRLVDASFR